MSVIAGDIADFVAGSRLLRQETGSPVTFLLPQDPDWPDDTAINPDTGTPYDAMLVRTNDEFTEVIKTCAVVQKKASPLRPQSDARVEPVALLEAMDMILDVDSADWPDVQDASDFVLNGHSFSIQEAKPFAIAGTLYRYLVYGAEN